MYQIVHFSMDMIIWGRNAPEFYMGWPHLWDDLNCCGVCDTPQQFIDRYAKRLEEDERTFVVSFTHVKKDPTDNNGEGGGWRWHKWGPYIGDGNPECEYLNHEKGFDEGVYVYHVYQTAGPEKKPK